MGEDLVGLLHTRTARALWESGAGTAERRKTKSGGSGKGYRVWGEAKEKGSEGSSPKVREAEEPCPPKEPSAPLPCLWLWWITLISLQSLDFVYPHSRDTTMHWVLPVYSSEARGPHQSSSVSG